MPSGWTSSPLRETYDVVIVGGAMYGSAVAWFLIANPDFDGTILVIERDPSYANASTSHTNSCMRQQFSNEINIRISQFAADYVKNFRDHMGADDRIPPLPMRSFGYMYLANNAASVDLLKQVQELQRRCGAGTRHLSADEIAASYPFYNLEDILAGNHNPIDEGYFDGVSLFDWWRRSARAQGVEFCSGEVTEMEMDAGGNRIEGITLADGSKIRCGLVVNASGPRAALTSRMAGIDVPVEPRKRYTFIFDAEQPLERDLPLTVDPSGVHMRTDGQYYMAGCPPDDDVAVDYDDFESDHDLWQDKAWLAIAHRVPQFEAIKLMHSWVGHYAFNVFDQNAIVGPHKKVTNFYFVNGFSGHGLQQAPAIGRGLSEMIVYGEYRSLNLSAFDFDRIDRDEPFVEKAII